MNSKVRRVIAIAIIGVTCAAVSIGCGISKDSSPRPIPTDKLTPELIAPTTTAP